MQAERPRRGQRRRDQNKDLGISINNFKEFLNSKMDFKLPEGYAAFSIDQKKETWKNLLEILKSQTQKLSYQFPDSWKQDEVGLITEVVKSENQDCSLDYEYEEMFLGNKKQLLIYKKCREMDEYLEKYRLPKAYDPTLKDVQSVAKQMFEVKVQRNIAISLLDREKLDQINTEMKVVQEKFNQAFKKFEQLMRKVFEHFKGQNKRTVINLEILRESIFEKLKPLANELQLNIFSRYPDVQNEEFLFIQLTKKNELDRYFDAQNSQSNGKQEEEENCSDESSFVSDQSEEEKQLKQQDLKRKALPPAGLYSIKFERYQNQIITLKVSLEVPRNKLQTPKSLQYGRDPQSFESTIQIINPMSDLSIDIPIKNEKFTNFYFRTRNDFGPSQYKNFKYFLNLDSQNNLTQNGNLFFIGEDKYLLPNQRSKKQGDFYTLTLAVSDFSMSSTQVGICDADGNSADWGLFTKDSDKKQQVVQSNSIYQIVNNSNNLVYQQPAIRLDKSYHIRKTACGAGYGMLLDAFGGVWVFGKNNCGQLGMKEESINDQPIKLKFFEERKIFITDIKASQSLVSFAIDSNGILYKWGLNQFHSTNEPIYDRFGKVINYSLSNHFQEQWNPLLIKKHFESERIVQVEAGNEFYLMLNNKGTLYGWGQCRNLGKGILKDGKDQEIESICNDIELINDVQNVSAGRDHAIVLTKQSKVLGWGNLQYLSNVKKGFSETMVDLTEEYGEMSSEDKLACGPCYTCLYKAKTGKIQLFGDWSKFKSAEFDMKHCVRKIECSQNVIAILSDKLEAKEK